MVAAVMEPAIFSLPLYDVVFPHIFHRLDVLEIWRFRNVSRKCLAIASEYFRVCLSISVDLSRQMDYFRVYCWILNRCEQLRSFQLKGVHCNLVLPASMVDRHELLLFLLADQPLRASLQKLTLENLELHTTHECFRRLTNSCSHLKELTLCSITPFDDEALALLTRNCRSLETLTLRNLPIGGDALLKLAERSPGLKHLCVSHDRLLLTCMFISEVPVRKLNLCKKKSVSFSFIIGCL